MTGSSSEQSPQITAPYHDQDLEDTDPYVIEEVAYSPLKVRFLCNYDGDVVVFCKRCDWETAVETLPEDNGRVQPDMCPDCAKDGEIGFVRNDHEPSGGVECAE